MEKKKDVKKVDNELAKVEAKKVILPDLDPNNRTQNNPVTKVIPIVKQSNISTTLPENKNKPGFFKQFSASFKEVFKTNKPLSYVFIGLFVMLILSSFFFIISSFTPQTKLQLGANMDKVEVSSQGNELYVLLSGESNKNNITGVKFTFFDEEGNSYFYETTEGIQSLSFPYKRTFWDWLFQREVYKGKYDYYLTSEDVSGLANFNDIQKVEVLLSYTPRDEEDKTVLLDDETIIIPSNFTNKTNSTVPKPGGGGGGGGGGDDDNSCTPSLTCADYPNQCGNALSDGCNLILDCSNNCASGYECISETCLQDPNRISVNNCQELNETGKTYVLNDTINNNLESCFNITVENVTLDCNSNLITGTYGRVIYSNHQLTTIKNCNINFINNSEYGTDAIMLDFAPSSYIYNNTIKCSNSSYGIQIAYSDDVIIENNRVESCGSGIWVDNSANDELISNDINSSKSDGIMLRYSLNNTLVENTIRYNGRYGVYIIGDNSPRPASDHVLELNSINYNKMNGIYFYASRNTVLNGNNICNNSQSSSYSSSFSCGGVTSQSSSNDYCIASCGIDNCLPCTSELVVNGRFDIPLGSAGAGWANAKGFGWTITGGKAVFNGYDQYGPIVLSQILNLEDGKSYQISYVKNNLGDIAYCPPNENKIYLDTIEITTNPQNVTYHYEELVNEGNLNIQANSRSATQLCNIEYDDISVKEVEINENPNLVVNGDFDDASSWIAGSGWSISGGVATKTGAVPGILEQSINLVTDNQYEISYIKTISGDCGINYFNVDGISITNSPQIFTAQEPPTPSYPYDNKLIIAAGDDSTCVVTMDEISVKQVVSAPSFSFWQSFIEFFKNLFK